MENHDDVKITSTFNNGIEQIIRSINGLEIERDLEYSDGSYIRTSSIEVSDTNMVTFREMRHNAKTQNFITKEILPIVDENNKYIGNHTLKEESDLVNTTEQVEVIEQFNFDNKKYTSKTSSLKKGDEKTTIITLDIDNKAVNSIENITIIIDKDNNITYTYMDNGVIKEKFVKNKRGTTLDFFNEKGQPLETYEYDQNGNALIKFAEHEKLADDFIFTIYDNAIPNHYVISHQIPEVLYPKENEVEENLSR